MNSLIVIATLVGVACAFPGAFVRNTVDVQEATARFMDEYNRLAKLAADAPDIDIYHNDQLLPNDVNIKRPRTQTPIDSGFNVYSFSSNFGTNSQFQPATQFKSAFHQVPQHVPARAAPAPVQYKRPAPVQYQPAPVVRPRQQFVQQPEFVTAETPVPRWTGPWAHEVPAGVNGLPQQVTATPEVAAARNNHYQILVNAYQQAAATQQQYV